MARVLDEDELIGNWTLAGDELEQLSGRCGAAKLGFALPLRFYAVHGRFPAGRSVIPDQAVAHVARLVDVPAAELGFYEWDGRTIAAVESQGRPVRNGATIRKASTIGMTMGMTMNSTVDPSMAQAYRSEPEKISRKNRKTFSTSRKIEAASSGAAVMSVLVRRRWKSNMTNPAKMTRPSTE